jgi:CRISPR/Cas system CMR-associated protein Cmr1 (group 7 of RAMP superfamily)
MTIEQLIEKSKSRIKILKMKWIKISDNKCYKAYKRVLTYSPKYGYDVVMTYRILDGQFVDMCKDVTHWMPLHEPKDN